MRLSCPQDDFFVLEMFMGSWAVHYFMHEILIHDNFGAKFQFHHVDFIFMQFP